jgi:pentatricopeptide repeat protein
MDAVKLGNQTINELESILNYKKAMEIRITLGNAYYLVNKFEEAKEQFDKVKQFNEIYQTKTLHDLCYISYAKLYLKQGDIKRCIEHLEATDTMNPHYHSTLIAAYGKMGDTAKVKSVIDEAKQTKHYTNSYRYRLIADILSMRYNLIDVSDELYENALNELIQIGRKGHQHETLEVVYEWLIDFYQSKRLYKKALQACQTIYNFRKYGIGGNK